MNGIKPARIVHVPLILGLCLGVAIAATVAAEDPTPGYNTVVPESILTPDRVETRLGTLEFWDGVPTKGTAELLYDNLDFQRGVRAFLDRTLESARAEGQVQTLFGRRRIPLRHGAVALFALAAPGPTCTTRCTAAL